MIENAIPSQLKKTKYSRTLSFRVATESPIKMLQSL